MQKAWMTFITTLLFMVCAQKTMAATLKVGLLAPDGTTWAKNIKAMAKEVKKATNGAVKIKTYLGGVQGDEPVVLRKIRLGQLAGGVFTGRTIGDINGDVRILEVPFSFEGDRNAAWNTLEKMTPFFNKGFDKNNFVNLGFFEVGNVYMISTKPANSLKTLQGVKVWAWSGDKLVETMVNEMKLVSVPLSLPDVLSSLSTGIIEAAYSSPMGVVALQWNTKVKYLLDYPITYSLAAFLVSKRAWKKIPAKHQATVKKITAKYVKIANEKTIQENIDAMASLKSSGIKFLKIDPKELKQRVDIRKSVIKKLQGKLFSSEAISLFNKTTGK